ncbi:hypothetical protein CHCC20375_4011 [Bacillus licheniformis]|nr:hypothetical protein CHCC20375_4011 [Bacillus licheniformis]
MLISFKSPPPLLDWAAEQPARSIRQHSTYNGHFFTFFRSFLLKSLSLPES